MFDDPVEVSIAAATDTVLSNPSNNQVLAYDSTVQKWKNATSSGGPVASTNITDSTSVGRSLITATDATAARSAIGAGTSSLALGTTSTTAKAGNYQPTADQITETSSNKVMTAAERTKLAGVATGATANATDAQLRDRSTHTGIQSIATVSTLQTELDNREIIVRWNAVTSSWPSRPSSAAFGVLFLSTNDADATAPSDPNLQFGDVWRRHPDAP